MSGRLRVKNWQEFQHYKQRRPPWIKLHRALLDDFGFASLPDASRALAPCIWLIASESDDGTVPADLAELAFRLRRTLAEIESAVMPLISAGYLVGEGDASAALASRKQQARPETEERREETEERREEELSESPPAAVPAALDLFTRAFNLAYARRLKPPALNGVATKHLRELVRRYGPDGAACLPLLAAEHDRHAANSEQRRKSRTIAHLLHDGTNGTFEWSGLLQSCDALTDTSRLWSIAGQLDLASALARLGCQRGPENA